MSVQSYEASIDSVLATAFSACAISENQEGDINAARQYHEEFANALSAKVEEQKFKSSIGSVAIGEDGPCDLWDEPIITHLDDMDWDHLEYEVGATAKRPKKPSADFISKIWNIKHDEADKAPQQTTNLCRQGADIDLSRQYSTNDRVP